MCKVLPAPKRNRPPSAATRTRRERAAAKQAPLPAAEQLRRADANRAWHQTRYPSAPRLDPMSQASGNPRYRDEPAPKRVSPRDLTFADIVYVFGLDLLGSRAKRDQFGPLAFRAPPISTGKRAA